MCEIWLAYEPKWIENLDSRGWARGLGRMISRAPKTQVSAIFTVHAGCPAAGPAHIVARVLLSRRGCLLTAHFTTIL